MSDTVATLKLTHRAALKALEAGMAKATAIGQPQCISVVDVGGNLLAFVRMDGARHISIDSARHKAVTASATGRPTGLVQNDTALYLCVTTGGRNLNVKGGVPIVVQGQVVGAVGVGSGTPDQDHEVALAAVAGIEGAQTAF